MSDPPHRNPRRRRDGPTPDEIREAMVAGRCYVAADLVAEFGKRYDASGRRIREGLDALAEDGRIVRTVHADGTVTYRRKG